MVTECFVVEHGVFSLSREREERRLEPVLKKVVSRHISREAAENAARNIISCIDPDETNGLVDDFDGMIKRKSSYVRVYKETITTELVNDMYSNEGGE